MRESDRGSRVPAGSPLGSLRRLAGQALNRLAKAYPMRRLHRSLALRDPDWAGLCMAERGGTPAESQNCFGQEGEDLILNRLFAGRENGLFVDIGAYHPVRYSNTYSLYCRGWRGINIDATPGVIANFNMVRPGDINVEALIASEAGDATFFLFEEGALNTSSQDLAAQRETQNLGHRSAGSVVVQKQRLSEVLDKHLPAGTVIDFFDIDVEGNEIDVLRSNDWTRYRPRVVLVEQLDTMVDAMASHETTVFLKSLDYIPAYKLFNTAIFADRTGIRK